MLATSAPIVQRIHVHEATTTAIYVLGEWSAFECKLLQIVFVFKLRT